jgi:hypothetical protein
LQQNEAREKEKGNRVQISKKRDREGFTMTEAQIRRALMATEKDSLTVAETAKMLRLKTESVRVSCCKGRFSGAEKVENIWLIPYESVLHYKLRPRKTK